MTSHVNKNFGELIDAVAREIVSTEHFGSSSIISTPLLYPSGAGVVVEITQHGDRFFVSDMGYGFQESELIGASSFFHNQARPLAEKFGIRFDNQAFFVAEATKSQLPGIVTIVANCSSEATALSAYKAAEKKYTDDAEVLFQRITAVFPAQKVEKNVEVAGSSTHRWKFAAVVELNRHRTIFEPVNRHYNSVVSASAKFHDVARLENPPRRVAMVKDKSKLGDFLNVLAQSASVVEYGADDATIEQVAA